MSEQSFQGIDRLAPDTLIILIDASIRGVFRIPHAQRDTQVLWNAELGGLKILEGLRAVENDRIHLMLRGPATELVPMVFPGLVEDRRGRAEQAGVFRKVGPFEHPRDLHLLRAFGGITIRGDVQANFPVSQICQRH